MTENKTQEEKHQNKGGRVIGIFTKKVIQNIEFSLKVLWLIFLYISATWLVLGTLSSQQFQQKIYKMVDEKTKKNYTVAQLISLTEQYEAGLMKLKDIKININTQEEKILKEDREIDKLRDERKASAAELKDISTRLSTEYKDILQNWVGMKKIMEPAALLAGKDLSKIQANGKLADEIKIFQTEMETAKFAEQSSLIESSSARHKDLLGKLEKAASNSERTDKLIRESELKLFTSIKEVGKALKEHEKEKDIIQDIEDSALQESLVDLRYLTKMKFHYLATMPAQLLTLILTISMGALGSIIFLTKELFNPMQRSKSIFWYLFRPFLGMVTAIAIFVLIKSGQIVITEVNTEKTTEALNPFFVSFLAIISGLLAEQAYEKIYHTGQSFFKEKDSKENRRWAVRLNDEIQKQNKSLLELQKYTGAPLELLQKWSEEKESVPEKEQKIIAAWLGIPGRELFTDESPEFKI